MVPLVGECFFETNPSNGRFYELLQHEMCKVNRFFELQLRTLLERAGGWRAASGFLARIPKES